MSAYRREAKEWFRCSPEEAVAAIRKIAGNKSINETYKRAERVKVDELHQKEFRDIEIKFKQQQAEYEIEHRLALEESVIYQKYQPQFEAMFRPRPFWNYWLGCSTIALIGISKILPEASIDQIFLLAVIVGAIFGVFLQSFLEKERKKSTKYLALEKNREIELKAVRQIVVFCPKCSKKFRFSRAKLLLSSASLQWRCPHCKTAISPPRA